MLYTTSTASDVFTIGNSGSGSEFVNGRSRNPKSARYVTYNDMGEKVVNTASLVNEDGTAHAAYAGAHGTQVFNLIQKKKKGFPLTAFEQEIVNRYWATNPTAGLATLDQLGGNHNGGITTKFGTADKSTTSAANFDRATRKQGSAASFVSW